jgi:ElaB/YqjD/DUF883 family membrane-anchored ribosome-binding protein
MENTHENTQDEQGNGNGGGLKTRAGEKVREIGEAARGQAGERVRKLTDKARERAQEQVEGQRERIASRVEEAASGLLHHAEAGDNLRFEAERRVAQGLESAAGYLHSHQTNEVAGDVVGFVRRHPLRSLIMAGIIGYLLGKLLS